MHHYKVIADFAEQGIERRQGTGFFIKSDNTGELYFITNAHVVTADEHKACDITISYHYGSSARGMNMAPKGKAIAEIVDCQLVNEDSFHEPDIRISFYTDIAVLKVTKLLHDTFEIHPMKLDTKPQDKVEVSFSGFEDGILKTARGILYNNSVQGTVVGCGTLLGGSSGSPVLNSKNEVVGLHHSGPTENCQDFLLQLLPMDGSFIHSYHGRPGENRLPIQSICMPACAIQAFCEDSSSINW